MIKEYLDSALKVAAVVAQLVGQLLTTPEIYSLNPVIGKLQLRK